MTVEYTPEAIKDLKKLDKQAARQILSYMDDVARMPNRGHKTFDNCLESCRQKRCLQLIYIQQEWFKACHNV